MKQCVILKNDTTASDSSSVIKKDGYVYAQIQFQ